MQFALMCHTTDLLHVPFYDGLNETTWAMAINYRGLEYRKIFDAQIAVIKVHKGTPAAALKISDQEPRLGEECVIVGTGAELFAITVSLVDDEICKEEVPKLYEKSICMDVNNPKDDYDQCDYFAAGASGELTGISSQPFSSRKMLKYLRKIYFLIFLNECVLRDLVQSRRHEILKIAEFDKYIVWRPHESSLDKPKLTGMGVIVQPNIILTNSAQDLVNNAVVINGTVMRKTSFIVYGKRESVSKLRFGDRHIDWRKAINLAEAYPPDEFEPKLALIKLCHKIPLNSHYATIAQLPKRAFKIGAKCVVIGLSKDNALASVLNADIVGLDQCENDTLKLHESIVCVRLHYNARQSHCEQIVDGSPLVCRGFIIGIGGMLNTCSSYSPRPFTGTFYHRVWMREKIAEINANTPILEEYTPLAKHIVVFGLIDGGQKYPKGLGVIIAENIVLTHYAEDLTQPGIHGLSENTTGFIIYGVQHLYNLKTIPRSNQIEWIEAKSLNGPHRPSQYKPQIALIKLNSTINLESEKAEILPLPNTNVASGTECVVVGLGYEMTDRIVAIKAIVLNESYCKDEISELNYSAICIDIPNPMGDNDQCDYFTGGAPLVCDGILTAISCTKDRNSNLEDETKATQSKTQFDKNPKRQKKLKL
uniref:Peptidase S1 domain-containing protein n=1 Tax=Glossina austeni TaxID=7395 RepID=A0A1A9V3S7_GLOAU